MSTAPRLHIDAPLAAGATLPLTREDAHYLLNVMRRGEGDPVRIFNGRDGEWSAQIAHASKKAATLKLEAQTWPQQGVPDLWLLFAPVKRQKTDLIVEKATELGVAAICPVMTARTQSDRIKYERFESIAKEAAEQTERLDLPEIREIDKLDRVLDAWPADRVIIFCDESGDEADEAWGGARGRGQPMASALAASGALPAAILIGPEGGFSPAERERLRSLDPVIPVTLGPRILRAETAVIAALTIWQSACGDWR
ncbi:16S rRNA (uracil(1498)-N(3))-methyltransferase [Maricaulis sp.]|uniref:16S rRNA (uracil(1498)-N(3))-methyltransferase n=1 Tax=Maricaulis sp. TaxID=1486257 RepID=UPI0025FE9F07|nr:16S rRNA (uracil(1498)-N(3))-methyltransferase [Maricaulis sp.]MDF1768442.1 16S rRNA (uracil(1498)-N(3))-methyltransferase [Maricaulis sp.]